LYQKRPFLKLSSKPILKLPFSLNAHKPDVADAAEAVIALHDPETALDGGTDRGDDAKAARRFLAKALSSRQDRG
jgi:hypothetical protein